MIMKYPGLRSLCEEQQALKNTTYTLPIIYPKAYHSKIPKIPAVILKQLLKKIRHQSIVNLKITPSFSIKKSHSCAKNTKFVIFSIILALFVQGGGVFLIGPPNLH